MNPREQRMGIGALIVGLVVGLILGTVIGEDLPLVGTAASKGDNSSDLKTDEKDFDYYLVGLEDAEAWLSEWIMIAYDDGTTKTTELETAISNLNTIAEPGANLADIVPANEDYIDTLLFWSQASFVGLEKVDDSTELPKDLLATICIALDDDPWSTDPNYASGVKLYLQVPKGDNKNLPKDWLATNPKSEFDIGWTVMRCNPEK